MEYAPLLGITINGLYLNILHSHIDMTKQHPLISEIKLVHPETKQNDSKRTETQRSHKLRDLFGLL